MTHIPHKTNRRGRNFPDVRWFEEEKIKRETEQKARFERCYPIFKKLRSELMTNYHNWYLTIEPETGEYFLSRDRLSNLKQAD